MTQIFGALVGLGRWIAGGATAALVYFGLLADDELNAHEEIRRYALYGSLAMAIIIFAYYKARK